MPFWLDPSLKLSLYINSFCGQKLFQEGKQLGLVSSHQFIGGFFKQCIDWDLLTMKFEIALIVYCDYEKSIEGLLSENLGSSIYYLDGEYMTKGR